MPEAAPQPSAEEQMQTIEEEFKDEYAGMKTKDVYEGAEAAISQVNDLAIEGMHNPYKEGGEEYNEQLAKTANEVRANIELARDSYVLSNYEALSDLLDEVAQGFVDNPDNPQYSTIALLDGYEMMIAKVLPELQAMDPQDSFLRQTQQDLYSRLEQRNGELRYEISLRLGMEAPQKPDIGPLRVSKSAVKREVSSKIYNLSTTYRSSYAEEEIRVGDTQVVIGQNPGKDPKIVSVTDAEGRTYETDIQIKPTDSYDDITDMAIRAAQEGRSNLADQAYEQQVADYRKMAEDYDAENPIAQA